MTADMTSNPSSLMVLELIVLFIVMLVIIVLFVLIFLVLLEPMVQFVMLLVRLLRTGLEEEGGGSSPATGAALTARSDYCTTF